MSLREISYLYNSYLYLQIIFHIVIKNTIKSIFFTHIIFIKCKIMLYFNDIKIIIVND